MGEKGWEQKTEGDGGRAEGQECDRTVLPRLGGVLPPFSLGATGTSPRAARHPRPPAPRAAAVPPDRQGAARPCSPRRGAPGPLGRLTSARLPPRSPRGFSARQPGAEGSFPRPTCSGGRHLSVFTVLAGHGALGLWSRAQGYGSLGLRLPSVPGREPRLLRPRWRGVWAFAPLRGEAWTRAEWPAANEASQGRWDQCHTFRF